jgi:hypothetical protein
MEDKRRHPRYAVLSDKRCCLHSADEPTIVADVSDVSRSGIRIFSDTPLQNKHEHDFVMKSSWIDHDIPIRVSIVWNDDSGGRRSYGARFLSISPENVFELLDPLYHDWLEEALQSPEHSPN